MIRHVKCNEMRNEKRNLDGLKISLKTKTKTKPIRRRRAEKLYILLKTKLKL